jgi:hypothetical protein
VTKTNYDVYLGAVAILNSINGVVIPVDISIKPFKNLRDLSFNIEFNPIYEFDLDNLFVRGFLGMRYKLKTTSSRIKKKFIALFNFLI